jgi:hypothetical protein
MCSSFRQIELKNYLLSRSDKTLLNGKKDIVKVLRGYIDRGQLNWVINERVSNLKSGTTKKQATSITVRTFPAMEQENQIFALPPSLLPNVKKVPMIKKYIPNQSFAGYATR